MPVERTLSITKPDAVAKNAVHGSDAPETAATAIAFFFPEGICERTR